MRNLIRLLVAASFLPACAPVAEEDGTGSTCRGKCDDGNQHGELPFLIMGHRGAPWSGKVENTLESFDAAIAEGANSIETDFCVTKDGIAVIWHDCNPDNAVALARQAGAEGLPYMPWVPDVGDPWRRNVSTMTLAELREHYDYQANNGVLQSVFANGERVHMHIPTLEEFVDWTGSERGQKMKALYVDVKMAADELDIAEKLAVQLMEQLDGTSFQVYIGSPYKPVVDRMRKAWRALGGRDGVAFIWDHEKSGALEDTIEGDYDAIAMGDTVLRSWEAFTAEVWQTVPGAHEKGLPVLVWTIDDESRMAYLADAGVDGILTNRPGDLVRIDHRRLIDHDAALQAIAYCEVLGQDQVGFVDCPNNLDLESPLRFDQLKNRACYNGDDWIKNLFGCGAAPARVNMAGMLGNHSHIQWAGHDNEVRIF